MTAVFRQEMQLLFSGLTAYVYGAFCLFFVGVYMMYYNLSAAYANFEYALAGASFAFILMIPIITMRIIAEEKKQKTDQLLYSLPITTTPDCGRKIFGSIAHIGDSYVSGNRLSPDPEKLRKYLSAD